MTTHQGRLLREHGGGHAPVTNLELFFDLVYVFAITQISQFVRKEPDGLHVIEGVMLFLALWWAWIYTAWATNWADPDAVPVRLMLIGAMLASLVMAAALPEAFARDSRHALAFVVTYCLLQIGRTLFVAWAMRARPSGWRNMVRIACWFGASMPLWLAGALVALPLRLALWGVALAIEYGGPLAFFRVPGMGRSTRADWDISGSHMAERASLFVLIALGEGIVVTGTAFAEEALTPARIMAFLACFAGSVLMWWIYFDSGADRGADHIAHSDDAGRIARNAYTYLHMPIVAGIIATAVADGLLMAAPQGPADAPLVAACGGGLILFLAGLAVFKRYSSPLGNAPLSHGIGLALLTLLTLTSRTAGWSAIAFTQLCVGALLIVAIWEWGSLHGGWRERLERAGLWRA